MAKSARASVMKKNRSNIKKKVFGPVESARNERLSAKLLELASQPKPPKAEMEVDNQNPKHQEEDEDDQHAAEEDVDMEAESKGTKPSVTEEKSNRAMQREKTVKAARIEKKRHRKTKNRIVFPKSQKKGPRR